jgi:Flp pilus assembly protein TadD
VLFADFRGIDFMESVVRKTGNDSIPILILIALTGILAYCNTFHVPFQFDDGAYIVNNPAIRSFRYLFSPTEIGSLTERSPTMMPTALRFAFKTRIIGYLSFAANYRLHGLDVAGYHVFNLLVHILNGMLVFLILKATLKTDRFEAAGGEGSAWTRGMIPVASSLLFVCHPIQTQAVTYLSQRFASLASFFCLLSLLLYIQARFATPGSKRSAQYIAALASAVAAMLTKEFSFTLPFLIALWEIAFGKGIVKDKVRFLAPFVATLTIIPALVFLQQADMKALDSTMRTITAADASNISRKSYLLAQFGVVVMYIRLLFLPVNQNVDHDVPAPQSLFEPQVFPSFLFLLALISVGVLLHVATARKTWKPELRLASFGILWFFISLSVESSVIPLGELVAEYRMYLPSVGMIIAVVSLASLASGRVLKDRVASPVVLYGFLMAIVIVLSVATYQRNKVWGSEIALWEDAARKSPGKSRPRQNLGTYYFLQGRLEDARRELLIALAMDPGNPEIHNNLGLVYKNNGEYEHAVREFTTVIRINPDDPMARYNLGNLFLAKGDFPEAIRQYLVALERVPDYDEVHNNLGVAFDRNGQLMEAIREFREAVRLNPENGNARKNLIGAMEKAGASRRDR